MTPAILFVLGLVAASAAMFAIGKPRVDVVALLVMVALALSGTISGEQAIRGFSNPSVVTVWAVFIVAGGVARTGLAGFIGSRLGKLGGAGEPGLIVAVMTVAGLLSAFMNNVGAVALLLPVVMDLSRTHGVAPGRLLLPLAAGSLLGGMTTLIGTSTNILANDALLAAGRKGLGLFAFTPLALPMAIAGVLYFRWFGRKLLPARDIKGESWGADVDRIYGIREGLRLLRVPERSALEGRTIAESRFGAALGVQILAILRGDDAILAPAAQETIRSGDRLLVEGSAARLEEVRGRKHVLLADPGPIVQALASSQMGLAQATLSRACTLAGRSLRECGFRGRFGTNVMAVRREGAVRPELLLDHPLQEGDTLLLQGSQACLGNVETCGEFEGFSRLSPADARLRYPIETRISAVRLGADSNLLGRTVAEAQFGDALGMTVLGIVPTGSTHGIPADSRPLAAGDTLLVLGSPREWDVLRGLGELEPVEDPAGTMRKIVSDRVGLTECVLSPRTTLAGKSLRQANFREKYGLSVLAIWREGKPVRAGLRDVKLRLGDALLLHGPREKLRMLGADPDFIVLTQEAAEPPRREKAPAAAAILVAMVAAVLLGAAPVYIAGTAAAVLMVLLGCLTMDEAYKCIQWRSVFLIAGMLSLGTAMRDTGAAALLASRGMALFGGAPPVLAVGLFFLLTNASCQFIPATAVVALLGPVAIDSARALGCAPETMALALGLGASCTTTSPVAHPAALLVMGPGGYRFSDYLRAGLPLTLLLLALFLLLLPLLGPGL